MDLLGNQAIDHYRAECSRGLDVLSGPGGASTDRQERDGELGYRDLSLDLGEKPADVGLEFEQPNGGRASDGDTCSHRRLVKPLTGKSPPVTPTQRSSEDQESQQARERMRSERAREQEARAVEQMREAERKADAATDPVGADVHRRDADVHARAARLHREASKLQEDHEQS